MEWSDSAIVLSAKDHGENALIVSVLTEQHGRYAGLVRGGHNSKQNGIFQPGNLLAATWRARLSEHLGSFKAEMLSPYAAQIMQNRGCLLALQTACGYCAHILPERQAYPTIYHSLLNLIRSFAGERWIYDYILWEMDFLSQAGFGLDLEKCAATGQSEDLVYVSPKTGRAVSREAGQPWADRLLRLPAFVLHKNRDKSQGFGQDILEGLRLSGYFIENYLYQGKPQSMPQGRAMLMRYFQEETITLAKVGNV